MFARIHLPLFLLALLLALMVLANPAPGQESLTNAQRFARGLGPKAPKRLFVPSNSDAKRAPAPEEENLTNAQRFARGLGPKAPRRLYIPSISDSAFVPHSPHAMPIRIQLPRKHERRR
ncbi:hypothetical protein DACRYDRAFT_24179 [Dacryopinax primogenitus]|uniref:Uncharacterized protein n=1 Tax=Dacryopinax primogenitus (strain DJM 731) TaxID=1858805 RepID=M5FQG3_DACPD|nr:uncharacterized protein DACRYDRAFT_24179 [Dacryopinax primogenitus]EJT99130.1 hypothetical protein DACRYDRAFT_24179 [Dacryopinax primogenitus]